MATNRLVFILFQFCMNKWHSSSYDRTTCKLKNNIADSYEGQFSVEDRVVSLMAGMCLADEIFGDFQIKYKNLRHGVVSQPC